ncbi:endolytic transglycosylase MltG [Candidatus Uhrbacteria bacterium]|nr:endolytic transglycosylase MltG [Candidatus Uhrbacteria bacterium]
MKALFWFGGILFLAATIGVVRALPEVYVRVPLPDAPRVRIEIPPGASVSSIADRLREAKLISSPLLYRIYAQVDPAAATPRAGEYHLRIGLNYRDLARLLARGPEREEATVRILEGWTIADVMTELGKAGVDARPSDFLAERFASEFPFLNALPPKTTLEGYLFPDTYRVWKDELPDGLFRKQLAEFQEKTADMPAKLQAQKRSLSELVTLASIVEKEARHDEDRPTIAGIFMNRLSIGMALQSDATLNYVLQTGRSRLTLDEVKNESPYNTYAHTGLPPGPIANPGLASLRAALDPKDTPYFYFLTDETGKAYYARTLEEHAANRRKAFGS